MVEVALSQQAVLLVCLTTVSSVFPALAQITESFTALDSVVTPTNAIQIAAGKQPDTSIDETGVSLDHWSRQPMPVSHSKFYPGFPDEPEFRDIPVPRIRRPRTSTTTTTSAPTTTTSTTATTTSTTTTTTTTTSTTTTTTTSSTTTASTTTRSSTTTSSQTTTTGKQKDWKFPKNADSYLTKLARLMLLLLGKDQRDKAPRQATGDASLFQEQEELAAHLFERLEGTVFGCSQDITTLVDQIQREAGALEFRSTALRGAAK
ncbi:UNVERIFIED_CONTAM: hypothetical protein HHA_255380 [Hammondia hammondi]|eukprot:XP_008888688.1 hypothetical protein HHA_255380 [Hammondia hammondi]